MAGKSKSKTSTTTSRSSKSKSGSRSGKNDDSNNRTDRSQPMPTVGIIGAAGRYGGWLMDRFDELGYPVLGADLCDGFLEPRKLVRRADVVLFSVPIDSTLEVIESLVPYSRAQQLWIDVTSLKEAPLAAMLRSKADVIGLHPMCGPDLPNWNGQTVALCYGRLRQPEWETFVLGFLKAMKARFYITDPQEHDRIMAYVQALPHALSMMMIGTFQSMEAHGLSVSEIEHYATPPYRLSVAAMSRILATHPDLYADIQISNRKHTLEVLENLCQQAAEIHRAVKKRDRQAIVDRLLKGREQFKSRNIQSGMKGFLQMSRVMADFSTDNSKVIHTRRDQPGLLENILRILARNQVNLTGLHSFKSEEYHGFSFHFGLEGEPDSVQLQRALCEIRNDPDLRDLVVIEDP